MTPVRKLNEARYLVALVALVLSAAATVYCFLSFSWSAQLVTHTLGVKQATSKWLQEMLEAETAQRGFVLTREDIFLDAYRQAVADLPAIATHIHDLTVDNPSQQARVDIAQRIAVARVARMQEVIDRVATLPIGEPFSRGAPTGEGRRRMDQFREAIANIEEEEDALLRDRATAQRVRAVSALFAVALFSVVGVYLLVDGRRLRREAEQAQMQADATRAAAELQLAASAERDRLARFQESFVAVLGHDLRNPLNSISMAHQLLLRKSDLAPEQERILRRGHAAAERMRRMIDQILDFTRARLGGGLPLAAREMDLAKLVEQVVDESRLANPERNIQIEIHGDATGRWDGDRLAQVLSNLIENAMAHGNDGSPIGVSVRGTDTGVGVEVTNAGEIADEVRDRLFDPFRRKEQETKGLRSSGLGLGLFITDQIVRQHGGTVAATSASGSTTFRVKLPRGPEKGAG
jgi:signal transduction histidine kinase